MEGDKDLIRRAKKGDVPAFEELISGYEKKVYNIVYRFFANPEDARDITQEIFLKIFTSLKGFNERAAFSTWLYRIVVNTCIDFYRRREGETLPLLEEMANNEVKLNGRTDTPESVVEKKELIEALKKAIKELPGDQKACVILRDIEGFSYMEISEILKCSVGTVKSRISRGRRALKQILEERELFLKNNV